VQDQFEAYSTPDTIKTMLSFSTLVLGCPIFVCWLFV